MNATIPSRSIELRAIEELRPRPNNARTHSRRQRKQIAQSIKRFGFVTPILVDGADQIIAGLGRYGAARELGLTEIPVLCVTHLSEAEIRAYVIADNRLAELAGWDPDLLAIELQGIVDLGFDPGTIGFEAPQLDIIFAEANRRKADPRGPENDIPAVDRSCAVARLGDLWRLGQHLLLCGTALGRECYEQLLSDDRARLVITDGPYNVLVNGHIGGSGRTRHREFVQASGEMTRAEFAAFLERAFGHLSRFSIDGSLHYVFIDWRHLCEMLAAGHAAYSSLLNVVVWNKNNGGMGSMYRSKHELIFVWKNGSGPHVNNVELGRHGRNRTNVWDYAGVNAFGPNRVEELTSHPTVKPVAMIADAVKDATKHGDVVLDPFAGSGTILIACEQTGRRGRAIELDPLYVDVAVRRWQRFAGKDAVLVATGQTFDDVEAARSAALEPREG